MKKKSKESVLETLLSPKIEEIGYELYDLTFEKKGKDWILVLFIDSEKGIFLDDCETVSRFISTILDEVDPIEQSYILEVSSPGIDRPLKKDSHYLANINEKINVNLFAPIDGNKNFEGILLSFNNDCLSLELENGKTLELDRAKIAKANRIDEINFKSHSEIKKKGE